MKPAKIRYTQGGDGPCCLDRENGLIVASNLYSEARSALDRSNPAGLMRDLLRSRYEYLKEVAK